MLHERAESGVANTTNPREAVACFYDVDVL
jgi:hypothetical protein